MKCRLSPYPVGLDLKSYGSEDAHNFFEQHRTIMVTKADYGKREIEASRSVLVELIHLLGEFKDSIVLVGGSVPPLLYQNNARDYVGTLDVDLAINHLTIDEETYQTMRNTLLKRGYKEGKQPFIFLREVPAGGSNPITVEVTSFPGNTAVQENHIEPKRSRIFGQEKRADAILPLKTL